MKPPVVVQKPSLSNLNLQVALYYNALFSVLFAIVIGACSVEKVSSCCNKQLVVLSHTNMLQ